MAIVRNCRERNASAPSCTAWAISFILGVPCPAFSTLRASSSPAAIPMMPASRQM